MKRPIIISRGIMAEIIKIEAKAEAIPMHGEDALEHLHGHRRSGGLQHDRGAQLGDGRHHVRIAPAMMPPAISRMVILKNVFMGLTPSRNAGPFHRGVQLVENGCAGTGDKGHFPDGVRQRQNHPGAGQHEKSGIEHHNQGDAENGRRW